MQQSDRSAPPEGAVTIWANDLAAGEASSAPLSVNQTLARAMTERFIDEMHVHCARRLLRGTPPVMGKRAAAYRATCRWFEQSVPAELLIRIEGFGSQDGKDKDAWRCYLCWSVSTGSRRLKACAVKVDARKIELADYPVAIVSEHALHRLFQRLNTTDYRMVLRELNPALERLPWLYREAAGIEFSALLVPTPCGALVFRSATAEEEDAPFVAVTWLSDERMRESEYKLRAVQQARAEHGVAVQAQRWLVISDARIARVQDGPVDERMVLKAFSVSRTAQQ